MGVGGRMERGGIEDGRDGDTNLNCHSKVIVAEKDLNKIVACLYFI